jgi:hypothetical protein
MTLHKPYVKCGEYGFDFIKHSPQGNCPDPSFLTEHEYYDTVFIKGEDMKVKIPQEGEDLVNNPKHYTAGGIECIDYLKAKLTPEEFVGFLKGNTLKYMSRAGLKNDELEDYKKAQFYINKLVEYKETI